MSRYATFVIDKEMPEGEATIQQLSSLLGHENSQIIAASVDNEIMRIELIENLLESVWSPDEMTGCIREILDPPNLEKHSERVN